MRNLSSETLRLKYPREIQLHSYWTSDGKLAYKLISGSRNNTWSPSSVIFTRAELEELRKQITDKLEMQVPDHATI